MAASPGSATVSQFDHYLGASAAVSGLQAQFQSPTIVDG
jgi:hypothetical protein